MRLAWLLLPLLFVATAFADSSRAGRPLEYQVQPASYGTKFFQSSADAWAKTSGVLLRVEGDPRVHDKVRVRVMAGDLPDATDATLDWEALIAEGKVVDLTSALDGPNWEGTGRWRDDYVPGILERWTRGGKAYGLPYAYAQWVLFYNRSLFDLNGWEPPHTWDQFFALCGEMRARGVAPLAFPGVYPRYGDALLRAGIYRLSGPVGYAAFREVDPELLRSPAFIRSAEMVQRTAREAFMPGWEGMTHTAAQQAFLDGRAAMVLSASWMLPEMRGKIPAGLRIGVANLPQFADGLGSAQAVQAQAAYSFVLKTGDAERERATVDFFRFLSSTERTHTFAKAVGAQVALRTVNAEAYSEEAPQALVRLMDSADAVYDAAPPLTPLFQSFLTQGLNELRPELLSGRMTPAVFAERLARVAEAERARIQNADTVAVRHLPATSLLLAVVALLLGFVWWRRGPRKASEPTGGALTLGRAGWVGFLGLPLLFFSVFVLLPGFAAFVGSFVQWNGLGEPRWVGLANFKVLLLESDVFWAALRNNLFLMTVPTLVIVPLALLLATLLHRGVAGAGVFRAVFLFPNLLGGTAAALLWLNAYDPHTGLVNAALVHMGEWTDSAWLKSFAGYAWLSPDRLMWALVPVYVWMACGFNLVLYLAAMQRIEPELYEAASIDGASPVRQFFTITLPLIWDIVAVSAVFIVVGGLNTFEMVWLLTSQEPGGGTQVLSTLMVSTLFREYQVGKATAIAIVLTVLVVIGSLALRKALLRKETEA